MDCGRHQPTVAFLPAIKCGLGYLKLPADIRYRRPRSRLLQGKRDLLIAKSRLLHRSGFFQSTPTGNSHSI